MPAEIASALTVGSVVGGRFRLEALVGAGGMGFVWRATELETGDSVALKFLKPEGARGESAKRRVRREAKAAMAVHHPNVVKIHDIVSGDDDAPVIVMEFLRGETLHARLEKDDGRLDMPAFAEIFLPVVSAVGAAHAVGVVHRDLKPENVWLVTAGDGKSSPRVLDFGIAKIVGPNATESTAALTTTGGMLGTPRYMAPEQVFGEKDIDHRADVWSLGVMAYECLSGKRPIPGDNVWQVLRAITSGDIVPLATVAPTVPPVIEKTVMRMLSVDRNQRPDDLVDIYDALRPYSDVEAAPFPHTTVAHSTAHDARGLVAKTVKTRVGRWIVLGASAAMLLGVAVYALRPDARLTEKPLASANTPSEAATQAVTRPSAVPLVDIVAPSATPSQTPHVVALPPPRFVASGSPLTSASGHITTTAPSATVDPFHGLAVDAPF